MSNDNSRHLTIDEAVKFLATRYSSEKACSHRLVRPHSYRGYYERLAFEREVGTYGTRFTTYDLALLLLGQVGQEFSGYKGGYFTMRGDTLLHIAEYGNTGVELTEAVLREIVEGPR